MGAYCRQSILGEETGSERGAGSARRLCEATDGDECAWKESNCVLSLPEGDASCRMLPWVARQGHLSTTGLRAELWTCCPQVAFPPCLVLPGMQPLPSSVYGRQKRVTGSSGQGGDSWGPTHSGAWSQGEAGGVSTGERGHWKVWAVGTVRSQVPPQPGCCSVELWGRG